MTETTYQRPLTVGEMIDVFRIERVLGAGGFGITYLAMDTTLNCHVALKEYFPQNAWREQHSRVVRTNEGDSSQSFQVGLDRFHKEGQALALFSHPNIVRVRRLLVANNTAYLVMDYEHGETLESYLQRLGRPLTYQEAEVIFNPLLDGLRAIHERNLLHLDIKPANIFLRGDGIPVLIDFGGARHQLGQASRLVSFLVASDGYAPNEQYSGSQLQPYTDIYAVGATIYFSITGRVPSDSPIRANAVIDGQPDTLLPVSQLVRSAFPTNFLQVVDAALSMRAASRPQSIREFQQWLFMQPQVDPPPDPPLPLSPPPPAGTNWMPILAGVGGVIALLLMVVLMKMPSEGGNVSTSLRDGQQEAEAIKQQAEQKAQERLVEAAQQANLPAAAPSALNIQPNQGDNQQPVSEDAVRDELVGFFQQYYAALDTNDASTLERLWNMNSPQATKSINIIKSRIRNGIRGRGCNINTAQIRSFTPSPALATIYIDATCDVDGVKTDRFHSNFDLEKNLLGEWKLLKQASVK